MAGESAVHRWGPAATLAVAFGLLIPWSWQRQGDPVIDCGREVYLAWRIAEGEMLFRDMAYHDGPLAALTNSLLFRVVPVSLGAFAVWNIGIALAFGGLMAGVLRRIGGTLGSALAMAAFAAGFAFARFMDVGNYSWVMPYSSVGTHGLLWSAAAVYGLCRMAEEEAPRRRWGALLGLCTGAVALTKPDLFVALAAALGAGVAGLWWLRGRRALGALAVAAATVPVVPALVAAHFLSGMAPSEAARATLGGWAMLASTDVAAQHFYRALSGLDDPAGNGWRLVRVALWWALLFGGLAGAARVLRDRVSPVVALLAGLLAFAVGGWIEWRGVLYPLQAVLLVLAVVAARGLRGDAEAAHRVRSLQRLVVLLWGAGALLKVALAIRLEHYGFLHAAPGVLALVAVLVGWVPEALTERGLNGALFRGAAVGLVLAGVVGCLQVSATAFRTLTYPMGSGANRLWTTERGPMLEAALAEWRRRAAPGDRFAVVPEGVLLHVLAGRPAGFHYIVDPVYYRSFYGEAHYLEGFAAFRPEWLFVVHRDFSDFGARTFGRDFAVPLREWIGANYVPVGRIGADPWEPGEAFGVALLRRRD